MSTRDFLADRTSSQSPDGSPEEQTRLEDAMRRADELLVTSLKFDERRCNRRRILWFLIGGVIMLGVVCAVLLGLSVESEKAGQLAQEGWQLWQERKLEAATGKFEEAVKADPKNSSAWNGLGWSQFNSGNYDPAETAF